jgi:hypothetical protein
MFIIKNKNKMSKLCENQGDFTLGDKYTIRSLDNNEYKKRATPYLGDPLVNKITHWYIDIETKTKKAAEPCIFTLGLKGNTEKKGGIWASLGWAYSGTELRSPDFSDSICNSKIANLCNSSDDVKDCLKNKGCINSEEYEIGKILRGKIMTDENGKKYKGFLNNEQLMIIEWFRKKSTLKTFTSKRTRKVTKYWNTSLPFTFTFFPGKCFKEYRGEYNGPDGNNVYYNCQKFATLFHADPEKILKYLKQSGGKSRRTRKTRKTRNQTRRKSPRRKSGRSRSPRRSRRTTRRRTRRRRTRK